MSWEYFDSDPITGLTEYYKFDPATNQISIRYVQDVEPVVEFCKELANSGAPDANFRKEGWLYAALPMTALLQMRKKGFDALGEHGKDGTKYLLREINDNYSYFKCTHRHHALK